MTSPGDDDLEEALRRALSEAASGVEPGSEGLDKIRARIEGRPPRPWLVSVLFGVAERVRNFTWRGHWARPGWFSRLAEVRWPRLRGIFPGWGVGSPRLAAVLAAVAVIAGIALGVQPLRNAILQPSIALRDNSGPTKATPSGGSPTPGPSPAAASRIPASTEPTPSPTPTATPSAPGYGSPGRSPPPFRSGPGWRARDPLPWHGD